MDIIILLIKYNTNTKIINISNKNIKGVLDLEFIELEELYCSNNEIIEIMNIPRTLKYLNCENNQITSLNNLPDDLSGINCKKNPVKELYYPFNIKPNKYPHKLTHLTFGYKFNQKINKSQIRKSIVSD